MGAATLACESPGNLSQDPRTCRLNSPRTDGHGTYTIRRSEAEHSPRQKRALWTRVHPQRMRSLATGQRSTSEASVALTR